jgi:hypothetical protein
VIQWLGCRNLLPASASTPFGNDINATQLYFEYEEIERNLTSLMAEKTSLHNESERYMDPNLFHTLIRIFLIRS